MECSAAQSLTRAFTHMSIRCDPRAPTNVPQHVKDALPPDPQILEWETERKALYVEIRSRYKFLYKADGTEKGQRYQKLVRIINAMTKKRDEDLKVVYRRQYFYRIHNDELQRQLNKVETEEYVEPVIHHQLHERTRLQEVICYFSGDISPEQIVQRRICAIDLMVALCSLREIPPPKPRLAPNPVEESFKQQSSRQLSPVQEPFPLVCEKTQCIFCYPTKKTFSRPAKMMDHVESHLRLEPAEMIACRHPVCKADGVVLSTVNQFKNHVQRVHGIVLREPRFVR